MLQAGAPIMHLRNMNAHVASALGEWSKAQGTMAHVPLQAAPTHNSTSNTTFAGLIPTRKASTQAGILVQDSHQMLSFSDYIPYIQVQAPLA